MIKYSDQAIVWKDGAPHAAPDSTDKAAGRNGTMAYQILNAHRKESNDGIFHISFDALVSHDITYVGIIQTARASGLKEFPIPYAMTNCHNSLCAVGSVFQQLRNTAGSMFRPTRVSSTRMQERNWLHAET